MQTKVGGLRQQGGGNWGPQVQAYLEAYCEVFDLAGLVRLNTTVERVLPQDSPAEPSVPPVSCPAAGPPSAQGTAAPAAGTLYPKGGWLVTTSTAGEGQVCLCPISV